MHDKAQYCCFVLFCFKLSQAISEFRVASLQIFRGFVCENCGTGENSKVVTLLFLKGLRIQMEMNSLSDAFSSGMLEI